MALHGQEREGHGAADEQRVGDLEEAVDHADLVGHLGPAQHRDEGTAGRLEQALESVDLALEQPPGRVLGHEVGDALGRGVRAVGRAESVVDVHVGQVGQAVRERGVVLGLARLVADVLEHEHVAGPQRVDLGAHLVADHARSELHRGLDQLSQPLRGRAQRQLGLAVLGPAQVRGEHELGAAPAQLLDGREGGADAGVVGDVPVVERDVEVDPHEDALVLDVDIVERLHSRRWTTSTTRLE